MTDPSSQPDRATGRRPRLAPLYAAGFVTAFGANGVAAVVGGTHQELGLSLAWLGLFLALYDVAELILKPVFGALSDRIGPRPVIVGGLIAFGLASLIGVFLTDPIWLAVTRLLQGAGASAFSPSSSAALARLAPADLKATYFGRYGSWKGLGYAGGPLIGAGIVLVSDIRMLFVLLAAMSVVTAIAVLAAVEPIAPLPRQRSTLATLVRAVTARDFLIPVTVLSVGSAAVGALVGMLPALATALGIPLIASVGAVTLLAITSSLAQPVVGRWNDAGRLRTRTASVTGAGAIAVAFLLVAALPSAATVLAAALLTGAGVAVLTPVAFAHLAATSPPERLGRTMGTAELGRETGDAIGPLVVGTVGMITLPLGFAAFGILAAAGALVATRLPHREEHPSRAS
ncbi:MFS transporter [Microbacterium hibisci]|uniref:MFS transporter n=1 Tax=Microbacterium hibisci TaxID=2036000 RepID=UPI001941FE86|nr:MFS transporter [Microbacterium hibisci]